MESKKEDVIDIAASIQIRSIQPKLLSFFMHRGCREVFAGAHIWWCRRVVGEESYIHTATNYKATR